MKPKVTYLLVAFERHRLAEMAVAVERAKQCSPMAGLQILAAAYEMAASSNKKDSAP